MKKFMFTAIALVAFSGISMANTIKDEKDVIKKTKKEIKVVKKSTCCYLYVLAFNLATSEGASQQQAGDYANAVESKCEKG